MSKQATRQSALVKNVEIRTGLVQNIRFVQRTLPSGELISIAKTRGLPKLIMRRKSAKEVIGHIAGQRDEIKATATSERSVFLKMVDAVWNTKPAKNTWHPTAV